MFFFKAAALNGGSTDPKESVEKLLVVCECSENCKELKIFLKFVVRVNVKSLECVDVIIFLNKGHTFLKYF